MKTNTLKKAAVIGLWHLGCTVAASLAKSGYKVKGFDFNRELVNNLNHSQMPVAEAGLPELTAEGIQKKHLAFSSNFSELKQYPYIVIAYDTPVGDDDRPNLDLINKAVKEISKFAQKDVSIIVMSQVPAGTCRGIYNLLKKNKPGVEVIYNPENLRLSQAIETYLNADRQILGLSSEKARARVESFYSFFKNPLMFMSLESAETVKHGINSFLAMSVSFINQLSDLAEKTGADITEVVKGLKSDSRIGQKAFLSPGLGFAGGTLGRDLRVLESLGKKYRLRLPLFTEIYKINQERKQTLYKKILAKVGNLKNKRIALLGLVYKPGTDTLRRSLSLEVGKWLVKHGAKVKGYDPALRDPKSVLPVELKNEPYQAAKDADLLLIITEWPEFKSLDYGKIKKIMRGKLLFDTKNILGKEEMSNLGFDYYGTGR